jgi:hypothetical protein
MIMLLRQCSSELEFLEPLKLPVSAKPGASLIGKAMRTTSQNWQHLDTVLRKFTLAEFPA